jgi:hypothetical protein
MTTKQVERDWQELMAEQCKEIESKLKAFPALVEALEVARKFLPQADSLPLKTKTAVGAAVAIVDAALKLAKGESK